MSDNEEPFEYNTERPRIALRVPIFKKNPQETDDRKEILKKTNLQLAQAIQPEKKHKMKQTTLEGQSIYSSDEGVDDPTPKKQRIDIPKIGKAGAKRGVKKQIVWVKCSICHRSFRKGIPFSSHYKKVHPQDSRDLNIHTKRVLKWLFDKYKLLSERDFDILAKCLKEKISQNIEKDEIINFFKSKIELLSREEFETIDENRLPVIFKDEAIIYKLISNQLHEDDKTIIPKPLEFKDIKLSDDEEEN